MIQLRFRANLNSFSIKRRDVNLMKRKLLIILAASLLILSFSLPALAAAPKKISKTDFVIKIGKKNINLLKQGVKEICAASGKKVEERPTDDEEGEYTYYTAKVNEGSFTGVNAYHVDAATLSEKGVTARGIKIGSTEAEVFRAYPVKKVDWDYDCNSCTFYEAAAKAPSGGLTTKDSKNIAKVRPVYYYSISFGINNTTKKVEHVLIDQKWEG